jgi:hypothetical protein
MTVWSTAVTDCVRSGELWLWLRYMLHALFCWVG